MSRLREIEMNPPLKIRAAIIAILAVGTQAQGAEEGARAPPERTAAPLAAGLLESKVLCFLVLLLVLADWFLLARPR